MISLQDQAILRTRFSQELKNRVRIDVFTQRSSPVIIPGRQECAYCDQVRDLMVEFAALSSRISLTLHDFEEDPRAAADLGVKRVPAIVLRGVANRPVRYFGMPTAAQFPAFVEALTEVSKGASGIDPAAERTLKRIKEDVKLQVLVTPTCTASPPVARAAYRFGLANKRIHAEVIEIIEFPVLAQQFRAQATPTIVLNEAIALAASLDEANIAECLLRVVEGKELREDLPFGKSTPLMPTTQQEVRSGPGGLIIPR